MFLLSDLPCLMAISLALWSSRASCLKPVLKHWMSLSWSMGPEISSWQRLLTSIIWSEELSSAGKEGIMTKMVKKILIIVIMVIVTIQITSPECFSRPTTSRDESRYSFSLEFEFFNFSHMIEMLEVQHRDIAMLRPGQTLALAGPEARHYNHPGTAPRPRPRPRSKCLY